MTWISRKPFESLVLLLTLYYCLIVAFFEPVIFSVKRDYMVSAVGVWVLFLIFGIAFKKELEAQKQKLFGIFMTNKFNELKLISKMIVLVKLSIPILLLVSLFEFMISSIFVSGGSVAIGFPLSIYSFSANKVIVGNLVVNVILIISVLYFVGYTLMREQKRY